MFNIVNAVHAFLRALPAGRFPTRAAHGHYARAGDRDQRFASGLDTLIRGLQAAQDSPGASSRILTVRARLTVRGSGGGWCPGDDVDRRGHAVAGGQVSRRAESGHVG